MKDEMQCKYIESMSHDEFVQFLADQKKEMEKYKWIESEKAGYDLGNLAIKDWICRYAKKFRERYTLNRIMH